jgi:hypothetical protein
MLSGPLVRYAAPRLVSWVDAALRAVRAIV